MYLELLKKCILDTIYDPENHPNHQYIGGYFGSYNGKQVYLTREKGIDEGAYLPRRAHSMIGYKRMTNLESCIETIFEEGIEGDFIETGVWRGGACIFMAGMNKFFGQNRKIFVADSFCGLPEPNPDKYPHDRNDSHYKVPELSVSKEDVENNFKRYSLLDDNVVFLEGYFKDTLPEADIDKLSLLRLDGDMYESTIDALDNLYHKLSEGGYIIIDDYALKGCRKAVNHFRLKNNIETKIKPIDYMGAYWRKGCN